MAVGVRQRLQAPGRHPAESHAGHRHAGRGHPAGRGAVRPPAAQEGAHGQPDQEPDQHQRRRQLRVRVDGEPGEDRDVDQRRDQCAADEEAHHQRTPGGGRGDRPRRHQRVGRGAVAVPEGQGRRGASDQQPGSGRGEDLHLGVRRGEREDHPRQGEGQQHRAGHVDLLEERTPGPQVEQRGLGSQAPHHEEDGQPDGDDRQRGQPAAAAGDRDEGQAQGDVGGESGRLEHDQQPGGHGPAGQEHPWPVRRPCGGVATGGPACGAAPDHGQQHQGDGQVDPEDVAPAAEGEHHRAVHGPHHVAELLHRADHAEGYAALPRGVEVGHQRQRRRQQPAGADALQQAADHDRGQVVGRRGHQRAEREHHQRAHQRGQPTAQVRDPTDQREYGDVAEEEARDDRRAALELVGREVRGRHHVRQRQDHDVVVGGREGDGHGGQAEQQPATPGGAGLQGLPGALAVAQGRVICGSDP